VQQEATLVYNRAFREAVAPKNGKEGAIVRQAIEALMRDQKLWDDTKQKEYEALVASILKGELALVTGGIKLSKAREVAVGMRDSRRKLSFLSRSRNEYDSVTAESQADQAKFNYLVSACTVYANNGTPYYKDVEDFLGRTGDPVVKPASETFGKLVYGLQDDYIAKQPENAFLLKYGFAKVIETENGQDVFLVDKKTGHLINEDGKNINEKYQLVNDKEEVIDADGNLLTEDGEYKVEFTPFEDDTAEVTASASASPTA
jgi:hypothetical protein